jgi:hypothetical protein
MFGLSQTASATAVIGAGGFTWTTVYNLDMNLGGGFDLGSKTFTFIIGPSQDAVTVTGSIDLGGVVSGYLSAGLYVLTSGGKFVIGINAAFGVAINIPGAASAQGQVQFSTCGNPCTSFFNPILQVQGSFSVLGQSFNSGWLTFQPNFAFSYSGSGSTDVQSGPVDLCIGRCLAVNGSTRWFVNFSGNYSYSLDSTSGISFSAGFKAKVMVQTSQGAGGTVDVCHQDIAGVSIPYPCPRTWDASWSNSTVLLDIGVSIDSNGNMSVSWGGNTYNAKL